jgi:hypothetical protein
MPTELAATFGGLQVFGRSITMRAEPAPRPTQDQTSFGRDGNYRRDGGGRGVTVHVAGEHTGASPADLGAAQSRLRALHDGQARPLQDRDGTRWDQCVMTGLNPAPPVGYRPGGLLFTQKYTATFLCLEG